MYSLTTYNQLVAAGWFPGRRIDASPYNRWLEQSGDPRLPRAMRFLSEFGGLSVQSTFECRSKIHKTFTIDVDDWVMDRDELDRDFWYKTAGEVVTPLGSAQGIYDLLMCRHGSVIAAADGEMFLVGDAPEVALESLVSGANWHRICTPLLCAQTSDALE